MKRTIAVLLTASALAIGLAFATPASANNIGEEGCTPGYWKNHTSNWEEYAPTRLLSADFVFPAELSSLGGKTYLQALSFTGGPDNLGAAKILMRATVAAFLNAAHEGVGYPYRRFGDPGDLQNAVNAALASLDRQTMLDLATMLDDANNLGCPLGNETIPI